MIDWLVYLAMGAVVGAILAFVIAMFKVGPGKPDFPFLKVIAVCILAAWGGPFAYMAYQTKTHKAVMFPVIKRYFASSDCPLEGKIEYIRIMHVSKNTGYALLVCAEPESWGGYDHAIMRLKLSRNEKTMKWFVAKDEVMRSARLNKDEMIWPPYK